MVAGLTQQMAELNAEDEEEAEEEINPYTQMILGEVIPMIRPILENVKGYLTKGMSTNNNDMAKIAGVSAQTYTDKDWEELNKAIDHLMKSGMQLSDFKKLVSIAADKPSTFNMYLTMLRS